MIKVEKQQGSMQMGRIFVMIMVVFCLALFTGCPKDIMVIEDSENDNGYLTSKAANNPNALRATSVEDMVDKVLTTLGEGNCLKTLTLVGHGSPGNISVGDGQGWESDKHIDGNREEWESHLEKLKGKFCSDGKLLLIGCNVGACDDGRNKLKELADFLDVAVEAPTGKTYGNCTEEEGSQHQIATPDDPTPKHMASPSDEKKKDKKMVIKEQKRPFEVELVSGVAIYPLKLKRKLSYESIQFDFEEKEKIDEFFSYIDFSRTEDGTGIGADYNARVFLKIGDQLVEYYFFCDYDYFLKKGDWKNMYSVSFELKGRLRKMMKEKVMKIKSGAGAKTE